MLYLISNKQYNVCFNTANRLIDIGIADLNVNKYYH